MAWIPFNPNPQKKNVGDCTIRAVSRATNQEWNDSFAAMTAQAFRMKDMPSSNAVMRAYLKKKGFRRKTIPDTCPDCYTLNDFCEDHPHGMFIVGVNNNHVVAVNDGDFFDSFDSGDGFVTYYYERVEE